VFRDEKRIVGRQARAPVDREIIGDDNKKLTVE
jgi:hypothetical protein